jgi:hypothetical protein
MGIGSTGSQSQVTALSCLEAKESKRATTRWTGKTADAAKFGRIEARHQYELPCLIGGLLTRSKSANNLS